MAPRRYHRGLAMMICAAACMASRNVEAIVTVGINLSGLEEGGKIPGKANFDFAVPSANEWAYFASKGIKIVRLPFKWERMQNISGPLSPTYLALVKTQLEMATNNSMTVILDCHNFGSGFGSKLNDPAGNVTSAIFADLWTKLATELLGNRAITGFDIMNEPNNMPSPTAWPDAAQAAITAIRAVDKVTAIYVEGDHWSGAQNWSAQNPLLHTLTDSTCTNKAFGGKPCIVWSAHCYLDRDSSGTHFNWTAEVEAGVTVNTGVERLSDFVTWLKKNEYTHAHIGELGTGNDNIGWLESLNNSMVLMAENNFEFTYWSAGPWFSGGYGYDVDEQTVVVNGSKAPRDSIQMAVLSSFSGASAPNVYFLAGPARAYTGAASLPFTLTYRGYIKHAIEFTCSVTWGGTHISTVFTTTCADAYNCDRQFTVTANESVTHAISCTNTAGLVDAPSLQLNASSDMFQGAAATACNVFSLRRLYTNYEGPLIRIRRSTDNATMNFTTVSNDNVNLDCGAIAAWCSDPCLTYVDTWFDQSPFKYHAGNVTSDFHGGGNHNVSIADQPQLVLSDVSVRGTGKRTPSFHARIHFDGSRRMDAKSPIDKLTGQTLLAVMSANGTGPAVNNSDRLLSWSFVQSVVFPMKGGYLTSDSSTPLPLSISHTPGWHRYAGRWRGGAVNGKTTHKDGVLTSTSDSIDATELHFSYRDTVNIGWFRWGGPVFTGDVREIIVFNGALSDGDLGRFDQSESDWLA